MAKIEQCKYNFSMNYLQTCPNCRLQIDLKYLVEKYNDFNEAKQNKQIARIKILVSQMLEGRDRQRSVYQQEISQAQSIVANIQFEECLQSITKYDSFESINSKRLKKLNKELPVIIESQIYDPYIRLDAVQSIQQSSYYLATPSPDSHPSQKIQIGKQPEQPVLQKQYNAQYEYVQSRLYEEQSLTMTDIDFEKLVSLPKEETIEKIEFIPSIKSPYYNMENADIRIEPTDKLFQSIARIQSDALLHRPTDEDAINTKLIIKKIKSEKQLNKKKSSAKKSSLRKEQQSGLRLTSPQQQKVRQESLELAKQQIEIQSDMGSSQQSEKQGDYVEQSSEQQQFERQNKKIQQSQYSQLNEQEQQFKKDKYEKEEIQVKQTRIPQRVSFDLKKDTSLKEDCLDIDEIKKREMEKISMKVNNSFKMSIKSVFKTDNKKKPK